MNFHQAFKKCSILTPGIRRKKPTASLESIFVKDTLRFSNEQPYGKILGGIPIFFVFFVLFCVQNIDGFEQNNSQSF